MGAVWAAARCTGSAPKTAASSAHETIERREMAIMTRFDVTGGAEIRATRIPLKPGSAKNERR
jgi:hypothetical protein